MRSAAQTQQQPRERAQQNAAKAAPRGATGARVENRTDAKRNHGTKRNEAKQRSSAPRTGLCFAKCTPPTGAARGRVQAARPRMNEDEARDGLNPATGAKYGRHEAPAIILIYKHFNFNSL